MLRNFSLVLLSSLLLPACGYADPVTVYSTGAYALPESITTVTAGFADTGYFVTDATYGVIDVLHPGGGVDFFTNIPTNTISAILIPPGYTNPASRLSAGNFLVTGNGSSTVVYYGGGTFPVTLSNTPEGATVAPAGFGTLGGLILLGNIEANGTADILVLNTDGTTSVLATLPAGVQAFGLGFAPAGFGSIGGELLVSDGLSGNLYAVTSSGAVTLFSTLPVPDATDQTTGLRQFAFAPTGFGSYGGDLFISVSGSENGGGSLGSVDILNGSGTQIADLLQGTVGTPYDPRGLDFISSTQLLISDASDADPSILLATASNFTSTTTPEPSSILLLLPGLVGTLAVRARARRGARAS